MQHMHCGVVQHLPCGMNIVLYNISLFYLHNRPTFWDPMVMVVMHLLWLSTSIVILFIATTNRSVINGYVVQLS